MHSARILAAVRCRCEQAWLRGVRRVFKFDSWHCQAPYHCRPYKQKIVELANSVRPEVVAEVGCGLGDILRRVTAAERFGFDVDPAVIRAARALHGGGIHWIHGDLESVEAALPSGRAIDCMIMVNWTHNLSPERLAGLLTPLLPRVRHLIVDAIDADGPESYRFKHDFRFLAPFTARLSSTRIENEPRAFIMFKVLT